MFHKHVTSEAVDVRHHYKSMANALRALSMDAVEKAQSGHPGMPMGMADVTTVLFSEFLKIDPANPTWPDRDRFILSAGHGSMLLYSLLYLLGYEDCPIEQIKNFRQLGAKTAGHPEYGYLYGIETTTGPLGQGIANAVGMALAERILAARFGKDLVDHTTYCIAGDGCLMEGISHEAISFAGHLKLNKLIVLFDDNKISIDGPTDLSVSDDQLERFKASGWNVLAIDGHDVDQIRDALTKAKASDRPTMIACRTTIAYGAPTKAGKNSSHGSPLGAKEIEGARENLGWTYPAFSIPVDVLSAWREVGQLHHVICEDWKKRLDNTSREVQAEFRRALAGNLPAGLDDVLQRFKQKLVETQPKEATRKSSGNVIEAIHEMMPELLGGSADLTGSNLTLAKAMKPVTKDDYSGAYIYYGVREHAMAAIMNGIALHKGFIPYGGTFLIFTDYCRPAIRLSAIMKQHVIYVMTHDSIGLGEDGTTHQPVEHLASFRAMPGVDVYRPADAVETLECWELALKRRNRPSILALSRQNLPCITPNYTRENRSARGAYAVGKAVENPEVVLMATGSEVEIALEAQQLLQAAAIATRVVSMPSTNLFDEQPHDYRTSLLTTNALKIAIEAASGYGWERYTGEKGGFIGMTGYGESGPAGELYQHFGITPEHVVALVKERLGK